MISKIKTELTTRKYMSPYKLGWTFTSMVLKQMNKLPRLPWIVMANWPKACYNAVDSILRLTWVPAARYELQLILSYDWLKFRWLDTSCGWFYLATDSNSGGWIRVAADSILWLEFWWLDTSRSWFYPAADSSSGGWMQVAADSILRLTRVLATGCELRLILSCNWFEFHQLDKSCSWFYHAADSSSSGWIQVAADLSPGG